MISDRLFTSRLKSRSPHRVRLLGALLGVTLAAAACGDEPSPDPVLSITELRLQSVLSGVTNDSRGTEFWLMFTGNYSYSTPTLSLFIAGDIATTGTVTIPGLGFSAPFTITPGVVTTVVLPSSAQFSTSDVVENKGIHVTAGAEVSVYGLNRIPATTDAFLGLPTDILGTDHVVLGYPNVNILNGTQFGFVASADDTVVTVTPSVTTGSHPGGVPYTVNLSRGQAYQLRNTNAAPADLSGTTVTSTKPIALYGGHECANIPDNTTYACDYLVEQLPPTNTWGRNFVTVPLATRQNGDTFRVLAATNGTTVNINGVPAATLNRGQAHQQIISGSSVITSNEPILLAQYSNGTTFDGVTSDPFMMIIPPHEQFLAGYTVTTPSSGFNINFINIAAPAAAVGAITLDGTPIPVSSFSTIGTSGFKGAQLAVGLGTHNLSGPLPFGVFVYGFAFADSYGYPGGMSLSPVAVVTSISLAPKTGSDQVGTTHCVTATVEDQNAAPVVGVRVDFAVTGAHTLPGFSSTDSSGQASFCYQGTNGGNDLIVATISNLHDDATFTWTSNRAPVARCADRTVVADGVCSADASVDDGSFDPDGNLVSCTQAPPPPYSGVGPHPVTLTCVDSEGATSSCTATVTVVDTTPPAITCPESQTLECVDHGAVATFSASATDNCGVADTSCAPPSGSTFGLGTSNATCSATDDSGGTSNCTFSVTVVDTQPPVVTTGAPAVYWPPNHQYQAFDLADCVTSIVDACDGSVTEITSAHITRITSDEAEDDKLAGGGLGDGNTCNDIIITSPHTADLRVERTGHGNGRLYTVFFDVTDGQGNVTSASCKVGVTHDQSDPNSVPDDGCKYCVGSGCGSCPGHDSACTN